MVAGDYSAFAIWGPKHGIAEIGQSLLTGKPGMRHFLKHSEN